MGKRRNRNKNRRRKKQQVWTTFRSESIRQSFEDDTQRELYKKEQKKDLKHIAEAKLDLLSRTVIVGSVLPLRVEKNKAALRQFLEISYGPVQKVGIDKKSRGKFPRGRVTFNFKSDTEKIFGGTSLLEAAAEGRQEKILCPSAGHKGWITARPSGEYKGMLEDDLNTSTAIRVNTKDLSLGHWFPSGKDACMNLPGFEDAGRDQHSIWVEENPTTGVNPIVIIDLEKALIELDVTHCVGNLLSIGKLTRYILSFRFKDLAHPMELCRSGGKLSITFALKHPPRLSSIVTNLLTDWEDRTRLTEMSGITGLGSCLGYSLGVSEVEINRMVTAKAFHKLKKMGVFNCKDELDILHQAELICKEKVNVKYKQKLETKIASTPSHRMGLHLRSILDAQSCIWYDMLNDKVSGQDIFELVRDGDDDLVERVLVEMRDMHGKTRHPAKMFHALHTADAEVEEAPRQIPEFCVSLPRVLLTPCQVKVSGFEVEMSNRIVRKFVDEEGFSNESFIRVSVGDENSDKLYSDDLSQQVEDRINFIILNGITLGKMKYRYLAYSSSQLKEQSLWMVFPEHGWTVTRMRDSMGDFSMCTIPSKYAARIGQCFSTTIDTTYSGIKSEGMASWIKEKIGLTSIAPTAPRVRDNFPDIGKEMVHSDGVGLITKDLLQEILKQLPFGRPRDKRDISAIQIRYGGAKGVLVAWNFAKLNISGYDVCLRPSQIKFKAPYNNLEVITIAKQIPYFLNRSVILLGQHKGIRTDIFIELQEVHIKGLNRMFVDASFAALFLPQLSGPDNGLIAVLRHMLHSGLAPATDPFLYSCLHCIRSHHLMNLRKKARVHVEDGAVLIGCIDELRLIPENCVFLQVQSSVDDKFRVITGKVMVTKHPVVHPGDMRMLEAVDIPELRGHKNIILFSQMGKRPEADKMSGSDLDGDQFAITWDPRLFLNYTSEPMDYSPPPVNLEYVDITDTTLLRHFINHARNDNLGRIAMLWLDHASITGDAGCFACLELAKLASIAVDFPKSGIPAVIPKDLILKRSEPRAHWRERQGLPSFHCASAVGQLYDRVVDEMKVQNSQQIKTVAMAGRYRDNNGQILHLGDMDQISKAKEKIYNPVLVKSLGWKGDALDILLLDFADYQRWLYEQQLLELMNQYKVKSEGEVATGCILKYHKLHKRRRHDVSEEVRRQFRSIRKTFRNEYFTALYHLVQDNMAFFNDDEYEIDDVAEEDLEWVEAAATGMLDSIGVEMSEKVKHLAHRLAAAYYISTYSPEWHDTRSRSVLYSFPWIVAADVIAYGMREED